MWNRIGGVSDMSLVAATVVVIVVIVRRWRQRRHGATFVGDRSFLPIVLVKAQVRYEFCG